MPPRVALAGRTIASFPGRELTAVYLNETAASTGILRVFDSTRA